MPPGDGSTTAEKSLRYGEIVPVSGAVRPRPPTVSFSRLRNCAQLLRSYGEPVFTRLHGAIAMESASTLQHGAGDGPPTCLSIRCDADVVSARQRARTYALALGFSSPEATLVATTISELARNIVQYAQHGEIALQSIERAGRSGLLVVASDRG